MESLVSIIVPVYNIEDNIEKCVRSLINQDYKNIEIILVNDGSTDNSSFICDSLQKKDNRIIAINKRNGGLSSARNYGLFRAKGDYILFIDGDDYVEHNIVSTMIRNIGKHDLVICNYIKVDENGIQNDKDKKITKRAVWTKSDFWVNYYLNNYSPFCVVAWNKLYKRTILNNNYFPVSKLHEDEFFINEIFNNSINAVVIPDVLYFYVQRQGSIMHKKYKGFLDASEAFISRFKVLDNRKYESVYKENLIVIPYYLVHGYMEVNGLDRSRYNVLKKEYNTVAFKYLRKHFNLKIFLKLVLVNLPLLYLKVERLKKFFYSNSQ